MQDKAQMHVLEVILVATLFTSVINVAVTNLPAHNQSSYHTDNLKYLGFEILEILDEWEESSSQSSHLVYWISNNDTSSLGEYLDSGLLDSVSYNLIATHGNVSEILIDNGSPGSEVSIAFRTLTIEGDIWKITLELWYE
ncbi:MAG: hypothetical protein BEU04_01580 [Marine Group III euryarchaeote CG-Bathy1]|uniref:Uncharacterized protein n=1 Tax=Marine Group III euryarchaeote CG-Bathy1 TaxID=1889001 RepID=A0A1J5T957_9ARCH|nr:MAG: hypothetical protein BEU04_01580 [Marine Group III euryarchaeote CG-Bathy1]